MTADVPPAVTCVAPEGVNSIEIVLKGKSAKLSEVLTDLRKIEPDLDLGLSGEEEFETEQVAVIRFKPTDPYRKIGSMIYSAQLRGVTWVAMISRPPICPDKVK